MTLRAAFFPEIGEVLVIHVRSMTDRERHIREHFSGMGITFSFVNEFDVPDITSELDAKWFMPESGLSQPAKSCCLKFIRALEIAARSPARFTLVFEDDVILAHDFRRILKHALEEQERIAGPFTIQLGAANNMHVPKLQRVHGKYLYEANQVRANEAFLITSDAARLRLEWLAGRKIDRTADHLFNLIDKEQGIRFFWLEPTIVEQGSMNGRFVSSIDKKRQSRSARTQAIHFRLKQFRVRFIDPILRRHRQF